MTSSSKPDHEAAGKIDFLNEVRFKNIVDNANEGIWIVDADFNIVYANEYISYLLGYSQDEIQGKEISSLMCEDELQDHAERIKKRKLGITERYERRFKCKNGSIIWAIVSSTPIINDKQQFIGAFSLMLDITDVKLQEQKLRENEIQFHEILESSHAGFIQVDQKGIITYANRHMAEMFKIKFEDLIGSEYISHVHADQKEMSNSFLQRLLRGELETVSYERKYICSDSKTFWGFLTAHRIVNLDGTFSSLVIVISDITKEKMMDEEVLEYKSFLETVLDTIPAQVFVRDEEGKYRLANKAFADRMGSTPDQIIGKTNRELGEDPDISKIALDQDQHILKTGDAWIDSERMIKYPDGSSHWVEFQKRTVFDSSGQSHGVLGVMVDLTDRRNAETARRESEEKFRSLYNSMVQGVVYQTADGIIVDANPAAQKILNISPSDFGHMGSYSERWKLFDEWGNQLSSEEYPSVLALGTGKPIIGKVVYFISEKHPEPIWVVIDAIPQFKENEEKPSQVFITLNDITPIKLVENELRNSELKYRTLLIHSPAAVYQTDEHGNNIYFNDRLAELAGCDTQGLLGLGWQNTLHPDDKQQVIDSWNEFLNSGQKWSMEYRLMSPITHEVNWVYDQAAKLYDANDHFMGCIGSKIDLTDRKKAEDALRSSEEINRVLLNAIPDAVFLLDLDGRILAANHELAHRLNTRVSNLVGVKISEILPPEIMKQRKEKFDEVVRTKKPMRFEDYQGDTLLDNIIHPVLDVEGNVTKLAIIARDITEQRKADEKIRKSEEKYRLLTENMQDVVWTMDAQTRKFTYCSPSVEKLRGFSIEEVMNQPAMTVTDPAKFNHVVKALEKQVEDFVKNGYQTEYIANEFEQSTADGGTVWTEAITSCFINKETGHVEISGVTRNITERKQADLEKQSLFEIMQGLALSQDLQQFLELLHHSLNNVIDARNISITFYQNDTGLFEEMYCVDQYDKPMPPSKLEKSITSYVFKTGKPILLKQKEFDDLRKKGVLKLVGENSAIWMGAPLRIGNEVIGVLAVQNYEDEHCYSNKDLEFLTSAGAQVAIAIERKRSDDALHEREEMYSSLIKNSHDVIFTIDMQGVITFLSPAWEKLLGYTIDEGVGQNISAFVHHDDLPFLQEKLALAYKTGISLVAIEFRIRHKNGNWCWFITSGTVIRDQSGSLIGFEGNSRDITEQKSAEEQYRESEIRWQFALEGSGDGVWDWDIETGDIYFSKQWKAMLGYEEDEIKGSFSEWETRVHPDDLPKARHDLDLLFSKKMDVYVNEHRMHCKDGSYKWILDRGKVMEWTKDGKPQRVIGTHTDITQRKLIEEENRKKSEDLTLINKLNEASNQGFDLVQSITLLSEEVKRIFAGFGVAVYMLDHEKKKLVLQRFTMQGGIDKKIEDLLGIKIPTAEIFLHQGGVYQKVMQEKKFVHLDDKEMILKSMYEFTDNPIFKKIIPQIFKLMNLHSVIYIPLISNNESVGLIDVSSKQPFTENELRRFEVISSEIASIIRRKQAEDGLRESEERFRQIIERSSDIFYRQSIETLAVEYISPKIESLLGYSQAEVQSMNYEQHQKLFHPRDLLKLKNFASDLVAADERDEKSIEREFRMCKKTGEYIWVRGTYALLRDNYNKPFMIVASLTDITNRMLNETLLKTRIKFMQMAAKMPLKELLVAILDEAEQLTESKLGFYHFIDEKESKINLQAWSTNTNAACSIRGYDLQYPFGDSGLWTECVRQRKPIIHNDYQSEKGRKQYPDGHPHLIREITIPVFRDGNVVAVFGLGNKEEDYNAYDLALVDKLADVAWDFIETKRIEDALRESEMIFNAFMENSPIYVFFKDSEIRSKRLSQNYEQMLGRPLDELLNKNMNDLFPSDFAKKMVQDDQDILKNHITVTVDEEFNGKQYTTIKFPILKDGKPEFLAGFTIDVTEQKNAEKKLAESEEIYRLISTAMSDYVYISALDDDNKLSLKWVAGAFEKITGYTLNEFNESGGWVKTVYPEDVEIDQRNMDTLGTNRNIITEHRVIRKNGEIAWIRIYAQPIWDDKENKLVGIRGAVQDITARKKSDEVIKKRADEFSALYETASAFSLERETESILKLITERAKNIFNTGNAFVFLFEPETNELVLKCSAVDRLPHRLSATVGQGITGKVAETLAPVIVDDYDQWDDKLFSGDIAAMMGVPMIFGGKFIGVLGLQEFHPSNRKYSEADAHFLTLYASLAAGAVYSALLFEEIKNNALDLEKRVTERTNELQLKNKELETFTYTVSHDLKAPLRGISGYSTLLMEDHADQLDEEGKIYLKNLVDATERMNVLIEDLLSYSRAERHEIRKTDIDLNLLVDKILMEYGQEIANRKVEIVRDLEYTSLFSDREALLQALRNLVDNAIKFTRDHKDPKIVLTSKIVGNFCRISVQDNGIGFDMKFHDKIFEIFQRLHLTEEYPGTGVGLALVRKAIERLGGKVWATSEIGQGSNFYMDIPL